MFDVNKSEGQKLQHVAIYISKMEFYKISCSQWTYYNSMGRTTGLAAYSTGLIMHICTELSVLFPFVDYSC